LQRLDRIGQLLSRVDADIVVLNEVDFDARWSHSVNQAQYLARRAGYRHWAAQRNYDLRVLFWKWRFGNAVLSKYPITRARVIDFPPYAVWEAWLAGKKKGVVCDVQVGDDRLRIIGAHLSPRSEFVRVESALMLTEIAAGSSVPVILAGDLNSTPPGFPSAVSDPTGRNALLELTESGQFLASWEKSPGPQYYTFPANRPRSTIDWILIPPDWNFLGYQVRSSRLSDHRLVYADVVR
jgi:endonuclease/exonuclease/phosphatase family metal-dependent hydrolase